STSRTTVVALSIASVSAMFLAGCSSNSGGDSNKIAFIEGVSGDEFYISMQCGIEAAAQKAGVDVDVQGPVKFDPTLQKPIVDSVVASRPSRFGLNGSVYDRIVQVVVYAAVILVPLFYLPWTTGLLEYNKQLLLLVLASVGVVVWLLGVVANGTLSIRTSPVDKGVLAVLVASILATIFAGDWAKGLFGISFSLSDEKTEELKVQAKEKAVAKAKFELEKTKSLYGLKRARLISISDYQNYPSPIYRDAKAYGLGGEASSISPIQIGTGELEVNVSLLYELK
ncbi:MAG: Ribose ABC transporter, substrate-binding protein, partial [Parcubacteria group bacterium GW2011_GWC1_45_9]